MENLLGITESYFIVGKKNEEVFPVRVSGFSAFRASDIQSATWYSDSATVVQMAQLLTAFAGINGDNTVFEARKQMIEYSTVGE